MRTRQLGQFAVAEIGLGCMSLSPGHGAAATPEVAARVVAEALNAGVDHFDTAALYGFGANERLLGELLKPHRQSITLASKCGLHGVGGQQVLDGRPTTLKRTLDAALKRLQTDVIDLYYLHRVDPDVPVEDSVGALGDAVMAGKIRAIGLSEVSTTTLRQAQAVHPITAVQSEYSLLTRDPEVALLQSCRDLGVTLVASSPLGRGFLSGSKLDPNSFVASDIRREMPRFQQPHFNRNLQLLDEYRAIASVAECTPAQLALAWLLHQGDDVLPIPGTAVSDHLIENLAAGDVALSPGVFELLETLMNPSRISGARYSPELQAEIGTEQY